MIIGWWPADYLIWVPADLEHASYNQQALIIPPSMSITPWRPGLPAEPCLLEMTPLIRAILADLRAQAGPHAG